MADTPKRIQRKRTKGWKMPEGAVYVGRPGKWGNPFIVGEALCDCRYGDDGIPFQLLQMANLDYDDFLEQEITISDSLALYKAHILYKWEWERGWNPTQLAGKDLACWCPLDQPCHADILLELANSE